MSQRGNAGGRSSPRGNSRSGSLPATSNGRRSTVAQNNAAAQPNSPSGAPNVSLFSTMTGSPFAYNARTASSEASTNTANLRTTNTGAVVLVNSPETNVITENAVLDVGGSKSMLLPGSVVATPVGKQSIQLSFSESDLNANSSITGLDDDDCAKVVFFQRGDTRDSCFMAVRDFDSKIIRGEREDGKTEQAGRASVRQAVMSLKLESHSATGTELRVLKTLQIIGKRAPCASLLTVDDTIRLLRSFGKDSIAERLDVAVNVLLPDNASSSSNRGFSQASGTTANNGNGATGRGSSTNAMSRSNSGNPSNCSESCHNCIETKRLYEQAIVQLANYQSQLQQQVQLSAQALSHAQAQCLAQSTSLQPSQAAVATLVSPSQVIDTTSLLSDGDPSRAALLELVAPAVYGASKLDVNVSNRGRPNVSLASVTTRDPEVVKEALGAVMSVSPVEGDLQPSRLLKAQYTTSQLGNDEILLNTHNIHTLFNLAETFDSAKVAGSPSSSPILDKSASGRFSLRTLNGAGSVGTSPATAKSHLQKSTVPANVLGSPQKSHDSLFDALASQNQGSTSAKSYQHSAGLNVRAAIPLAFGSTGATKTAQNLISTIQTACLASPNDPRRGSLLALANLLSASLQSDGGISSSASQPSVYLSQIAASVGTTTQGPYATTPQRQSYSASRSPSPTSDPLKFEQGIVKLEQDTVADTQSQPLLPSGNPGCPLATNTTASESTLPASRASSTPVSTTRSYQSRFLALVNSIPRTGAAATAQFASASAQATPGHTNESSLIAEPIPISTPTSAFALLLTHPALALLPSVVLRDLSQSLQRTFSSYLESLMTHIVDGTEPAGSVSDDIASTNDTITTRVNVGGSPTQLDASVMQTTALSTVAATPFPSHTQTGLNSTTPSDSSLTLSGGSSFGSTIAPSLALVGQQSTHNSMPLQSSPPLPYAITANGGASAGPGDGSSSMGLQTLGMSSLDRPMSQSTPAYGTHQTHASTVILPRTLSSNYNQIISSTFGGTGANTSPTAVSSSLMQTQMPGSQGFSVSARNSHLGLSLKRGHPAELSNHGSIVSAAIASPPQQGAPSYWTQGNTKRRQSMAPGQPAILGQSGHHFGSGDGPIASPGPQITTMAPGSSNGLGLFLSPSASMPLNTAALATKRVGQLSSGAIASPAAILAAVASVAANSTNTSSAAGTAATGTGNTSTQNSGTTNGNAPSFGTTLTPTPQMRDLIGASTSAPTLPSTTTNPGPTIASVSDKLLMMAVPNQFPYPLRANAIVTPRLSARGSQGGGPR